MEFYVSNTSCRTHSILQQAGFIAQHLRRQFYIFTFRNILPEWWYTLCFLRLWVCPLVQKAFCSFFQLFSGCFTCGEASCRPLWGGMYSCKWDSRKLRFILSDDWLWEHSLRSVVHCVSMLAEVLWIMFLLSVLYVL